VYGRQRKFFDRGEGTVRGADAELNLTELFKPKNAAPGNTKLIAGGSIVSRYQSYTGPDPNFPATVNAYSGRLELSGNKASVSVEYVGKKKDPHLVNLFDTTNGKALLVNISYGANNFGANFTYRGVHNMDYRSERNAELGSLLVNYIPALTRQHDYLLANIYVYNAQVNGEAGGQLDLYYSFPKGSALGGKYGTRVALNLSRYNSLRNPGKVLNPGNTEYFHDYNLEIKKKWSNAWRTNLTLYHIGYNKSVIEGGSGDTLNAGIVVLETTYKYSKRNSFRFELQHLSTTKDKKNWAALVTELNFASRWSAFVADMYNYGADKKVHYFQLGGSFTQGPTRFILSYGRQRPGLLCLGGVCRIVPAASGLNATLFTTF
jgi:Family of unknown function (DUF6029)